MEEIREKKKFEKFHDKHYKTLLLIPILLMIISFIYLGIFYANNEDYIYRDISLTGNFCNNLCKYRFYAN